MGGLSIWHILIVAMIAVLLFGGRGKISELMGDVAKGIKSFKKGLSEEDSATADPKVIGNDTADTPKETAKDKVTG